MRKENQISLLMVKSSHKHQRNVYYKRYSNERSINMRLHSHQQVKIFAPAATV